MRAILCFLGIHKWKYYELRTHQYGKVTERLCIFCPTEPQRYLPDCGAPTHGGSWLPISEW